MLHNLVQTHTQSIDVFTLVLRLALAAVIFPHGAQKLLGWHNGFGYRGTMGYFTQTMHIPYPLGVLAIIAEFFGPLALVAGVFTRPAAFGIGATLLAAAWMVHRPHGFFMNWFGNQEGEGYEYFILAVSMSAALVITGAGSWSLDHVLANHTL